MKYERAKRIGEECGLSRPAEYINNITLHAMNLFLYTEIIRELEELQVDAVAHGVRFSIVCGDAILAEDSDREPCYICRALSKVGGETESR